MKATDLSIFYQLGANIAYLVDHAKIGEPVGNLLLLLTLRCQWLVAFRSQTEELADTFQDTRVVVDHFIQAIHGLMDDIPKDWDRTITEVQVQALFYWKDKLEEAFVREHRNLDVFTVTPKGLYSTRLLINKPENDFPVELRSALPNQTVYDLQQASRSLAFDIPTACAFHVCRATESLMLAYYAKLTGHGWQLPKNRDWSQYIDHLRKEGAPAKIVDRLKEIKDSDRNALIHPDINVPLDEAHVLFKLCAAVNLFMMKELVK